MSFKDQEEYLRTSITRPVDWMKKATRRLMSIKTLDSDFKISKRNTTSLNNKEPTTGEKSLSLRTSTKQAIKSLLISKSSWKHLTTIWPRHRQELKINKKSLMLETTTWETNRWFSKTRTKRSKDWETLTTDLPLIMLILERKTIALFKNHTISEKKMTIKTLETKTLLLKLENKTWD